MKMKRRFPLLAIYSRYGTVMRACHSVKRVIFPIKGIRKGYLYCDHNCTQKSEVAMGLVLAEEPLRTKRSEVPSGGIVISQP